MESIRLPRRVYLVGALLLMLAAPASTHGEEPDPVVPGRLTRLPALSSAAVARYPTAVRSDGDGGEALRALRSAPIDSSLGGDELWSTAFWGPGAYGPPDRLTDGSVEQLLVHDGELVAVGEIGYMDGERVDGVAAWNGARWRALGDSPAFWGGPSTQHEWQGRLVIGGSVLYDRNDSSCVRAWDGSRWSPLEPGGPRGAGWASIYAFTTYRGFLVAGGVFGRVGGMPAPGVAAWDGRSWTAVGSDSLHGDPAFVTDLAVYRDTLWAAGFLRFGPADSTRSLAKWDGERWRYVENGPAGWVSALGVHQDRLYASGQFDSAGHVPARGIASWDGTSWRPLGEGLALRQSSGFARALRSAGDRLLVAGWFDSAGGRPAVNAAAWDGSSWSSVGEEPMPSTTVTDIAEYQGRAFLAGATIGASRQICAWNGHHWGAVDPSGCQLAGPPYALFPQTGGILAGATFAEQVDGERYRVGRWDGFGWSLVGPPLDAHPAALREVQGTLYAAVAVDADSVWIGRVLRLERGAWRQVGEDFRGPVLQILEYRGKLLAAGEFSRVGGDAGNGIVWWDESRWVPLAGGVLGHVRDLCLFQGELHVAGRFLRAGEVDCSGLARWNGTHWSAVPVDLAFRGWPPELSDIEVCQGDLAVLGNFSAAGGQASEGLALWNGQSWRSAPSLGGGAVSCLGSHDGRLVLGGWFRTGASAIDEAYAYQFDGERWLRMGTSVTSGRSGSYSFPSITAMATWDDRLYLGGRFESAGGRPSHLMASWDGRTVRPVAAPPVLHLWPNPARTEAFVSWTQSRPGYASVGLFDVAGRCVGVGGPGEASAGRQTWRLPDGAGRLGAGVYLVRVSGPDGVAATRLVITR